MSTAVTVVVTVAVLAAVFVAGIALPGFLARFGPVRRLGQAAYRLMMRIDDWSSGRRGGHEE